MTNKTIIKIILAVVALMPALAYAKTDNRSFRIISAANGLADNSAQTIDCTFSGRMIVSSLGSINIYDGGYFLQVSDEGEYTYTEEEAADYRENFGALPVEYYYKERITNNCIRAFTQPADTVVFSEYADSLPLNAEITLTSPEGKDIMYSINYDEPVLYTEPIIFDLCFSANPEFSSGII